jgi:hypothetical protein
MNSPYPYLIAQLSAQAGSQHTSRTPLYWLSRLMLFALLYGVSAQWFAGLPSDWQQQLSNPWFTVEIGLLVALLASSALATVLCMYPDAFQLQQLVALPFLVAGLLMLCVSLAASTVASSPTGNNPVASEAHQWKCSLFIALVAIAPAAFGLYLLKKEGASTRPLQSACFVLLTATTMGCLCLRLSEPNAAYQHVMGWHYLPACVLSLLGASSGRHFLKW